MNQESKSKHVPKRKCIICGNMFAKQDLHRFFTEKTGVIDCDTKGFSVGKGIYICRNALCINNSLNKKKWRKSFREKLTPKALAYLSHINSGAEKPQPETADSAGQKTPN